MEEFLFQEITRTKEYGNGESVIVIKWKTIFMEKRLRGRMSWYCKDELIDY